LALASINFECWRVEKMVAGTGFEPVFWVFRSFLIPAYLEHLDRINTVFMSFLCQIVVCSQREKKGRIYCGYFAELIIREK
jgi:hypothetical protein